ncbi:Cysteine-rich receptor-like protein kinase 41 [Hordeum vulgare]|nr:Cysteine-rich receptor-like protein kinase 41 [Hordeum vulgare]
MDMRIFLISTRKINFMDGGAEGLLVMPFDLLREVTNDFSEERKLGSGSFGKVYKGVHQDGVKIAVKMLYDMPGLDDELFQNEFKNLTRLRHQNIVRLVGYCHDIQEADRNIFFKIHLINMSNIYTMDPSLISMLSVYFENLDIIITPISTCFEENADPTETRLDGDLPNDNQDYSSGGDLLPGIEGFQVVGNPIPGSTLRACGFSINGTTRCNFQWVHYLEDGNQPSK